MIEIPRKVCKENNRVIIRVWTSWLNKSIPGAENSVGHISIEIPNSNCYISLWPEGSPNEKRIKAIIENREPHFMISYNDDYEAEEKHPPEVTICLYSLNTEKMEEEFNRLTQTTENWTLFGNVFLLKNSNQHNCASFAYEILKKGEIYNLISPAFSTKYSSVVSPDALVSAIKAAKEQENTDYKETVGFKFDNETILPSKSYASSPAAFWGKTNGRTLMYSGAVLAVGIGITEMTGITNICNIM
jgi:hypothetical protein